MLILHGEQGMLLLSLYCNDSDPSVSHTGFPLCNALDPVQLMDGSEMKKKKNQEQRRRSKDLAACLAHQELQHDTSCPAPSSAIATAMFSETLFLYMNARASMQKTQYLCQN